MGKKINFSSFFKNNDHKWTIIQFPNPLLLTWIILVIIQLFMSDSSLKSNIQHLNSALIFAWAYLEATAGDSMFRRLLGGVIIFLIVVSYFT